MPERELLPTNVKPNSYSISLKLNFDTFTFSGHEDVNLDVIDSATSSITLHAQDLKLEATSIRVKQGDKEYTLASTSDVTYDSKKTTASFTLNNPLEVGAAVLSLDFE